MSPPAGGGVVHGAITALRRQAPFFAAAVTSEKMPYPVPYRGSAA